MMRADDATSSDGENAIVLEGIDRASSIERALHSKHEFLFRSLFIFIRQWFLIMVGCCLPCAVFYADICSFVFVWF